MNPICIRPATREDSAVITDFNALLAEETEGRSLDRELLRRGVSRLLEDPTKGRYYLAHDNGVVVGQLMITFEWSDWRCGTFWWIQSVYVKREARGAGIFRRLYDFVHDEARRRGDVVGFRLYVDRHNEAAQATYLRLGMTKSEYELFELEFTLPPA